MAETNSPVLTQGEAQTLVAALTVGGANENKQTRAKQFEKYQNFILRGIQWESFEAKEGDDPELTFNKSEEYADTYLSKLFARNPETGAMEVGVRSLEKEKSKKEKYENEIFSCYRQNKIAATLLEQGQNFFIGGDAAIYYPQDPITKKAKIISLDPTSLWLGWEGSHLSEFAFEDEISLAEAEEVKKETWLTRAITAVMGQMTGEGDKRTRKVKRITYWNTQAQIIQIGNHFEVKKNETGVLPLSWIPNKPIAHKHEGRSEFKSLWSLERENNFRMSDFGLRVKKNTAAILALFTKKDAAKLEENRVEGILPLAPEDKAEFLKIAENKEVLDYIETIENRMDRKMAINDAVNGTIKSNVSSLAMLFYFSPLLDRIALKRVYWDEAFRELNRAILTYAFGSGNFETDPIYNPVMAVDQETKTKNIVLMLQNRLISHVDAIDALRGGENATEKIAEIEAEMKRLGNVPGFLNSKIAETSPTEMQ